MVECATGLALITDPALVVRLLLGADIAGIAVALARFFGVALVAFGLACWPGKTTIPSDASAFRGMLVYNALVALYLGYLGAVAHVTGLLLWPAVALHAAVAVLLAWAWKREQGSSASSPLRKLALAGLFALIATGTSTRQASAQAMAAASPPAITQINVEALKGTWVRPDGGYRIAIENVGSDGQIEAMYFNPDPLPFAKAQAAQDGATLRAFFELRAGGYGGSTYELTYDPASDRLKGTYYQAVAKQRFQVYFVRKRATP